MKTNKFDMKRIVFIIGVLIMTLKINAQEYPKVILPGDYPDPTIVRDGAGLLHDAFALLLRPGFPHLAFTRPGELATRVPSHSRT